MLAIQNISISFLLYITDLAGAPATSLTYASVVGKLKKEGSGAFSVLTLNSANFLNSGYGYYTVILSSSDTDTLGSLTVLVQGASIKDSVETGTVIQAGTSAASPSITTPTTVIYGFIRTAQGNSASNASVTATILNSPLILTSGTTGFAVTSDAITSKTDSNGYFALSLIAAATVDINIPSIHYRRTITVPSSTANLFDL